MAAPKHIIYKETKDSCVKCIISHHVTLEDMERECYSAKQIMFDGRDGLTDAEIEALADASAKYELKKMRGILYP